MNILFVDDFSSIKVEPAIKFLKEHQVDFTYNICKSINEALRYLHNNMDIINIAVIDLCLPQLNDGNPKDLLAGLEIVDFIIRKRNGKNFPIIINSSTSIEEIGTEYQLANYQEAKNTIPIEQVYNENYLGEFLYNYINNNIE